MTERIIAGPGPTPSCSGSAIGGMAPGGGGSSTKENPHSGQVVVFFANVGVPFATDIPRLSVQLGGWIGWRKKVPWL
jgi:phage-related minor tail protein